LVRERDKRKVIWPSYFDVKLSKAGGRRVKKGFCTENPDLEKLSQAIKSLNLKFEVESDKSFPSRWWKKEGRILVSTEMTKSELLNVIGQKLNK